MPWTTRIIYEDAETGDLIMSKYIKDGTYRIILKSVKYEQHGQYNIKTITNLVRRVEWRQQRIDFERTD